MSGITRLTKRGRPFSKGSLALLFVFVVTSAWASTSALLRRARGARTLSWIGVPLPPSTRDYHESERGLNATMLRARFDVDPSDIPAVERELCTLGSPASVPSRVASVTRGDLDWYTPEVAVSHRDCKGRLRMPSMTHVTIAMTVDVSDPARARVYLVASD